MQGIRNRGVPDKNFEGHDGERGLVGSFENDRTASSSLLHLKPARRADAPAIAGLESGEAKLWHGRAEVVSELLGNAQKILVHDAADRMNPKVVGPVSQQPVR